MGIFNATTALASMIGATLGGWLAASYGYHTVLGLAVVGLTLGLSLAALLRPMHR